MNMKNLKKIMNKLKKSSEINKNRNAIKKLKKAFLEQCAIDFDNKIVPIILEQEKTKGE